MIYLHNSDLGLHGNLRSSNCVVTSRWTLQVADFGLHELRFASETASGCENTLNYKLLWRAPELLRNMKEGGQGRGSQKGDVYSFGIILYEIYGRAGPYGDTAMTNDKIVDSVCRPNGVELMRPDLEMLEETELDYSCPEYVIG